MAHLGGSSVLMNGISSKEQVRGQKHTLGSHICSRALQRRVAPSLSILTRGETM